MKDPKAIQTEIDDIDRLLKDKHPDENIALAVETVLTARKQALLWVLIDEEK